MADNQQEQDTEKESAFATVALIILFSPALIFFGWYAAIFAMSIRNYLRIPYLVNMVFIYTLLLIPLWQMNSHGYPIPAIASAVVMVLLIGGICVSGKDEILDGENVEVTALPHMALVMAYVGLWFNNR